MDKDKGSTRADVRNAVRQWTTKYTEKCQLGITKMQWAIHDKRILETVVVNIRNYMDDLVKVFPPDKAEKLLATQQNLQEEDVENLSPRELKMLKDLAERDYDDMLVKAVEHAIKYRNSSSHIYGGEWTVKGEDRDFKHSSGDDVARGATGTGHIYTGKYDISGSGTSNFGNKYE